MKKFLFSLFTILAISMVFVSCKPEADEHVEITSPDELVFLLEGTWSGTSDNVTITNKAYTQMDLLGFMMGFVLADECYTNKSQTIFYLKYSDTENKKHVINLKKD